MGVVAAAATATATATLELILLGKASFGEAHQLIENGEFELQFDGIDHRLDGCLRHVVVGEFQADQDDVHGYADAIDNQQLHHHLSRHAVVDAAEQANGGHNVYGGDGEFLQAEAHQLDAFHDVELRSPELSIG